MRGVGAAARCVSTCGYTGSGNKVWFKKKEHKIEHDVQNAASVSLGAHGFVKEMFDFLDAKIQELVKCKAVAKLPRGIKSNVLTQLSLALKAGSGKDLWRIIMEYDTPCVRYLPPTKHPFLDSRQGHAAGECSALSEKGADGAFSPFLGSILW